MASCHQVHGKSKLTHRLLSISSPSSCGEEACSIDAENYGSWTCVCETSLDDCEGYSINPIFVACIMWQSMSSTAWNSWLSHVNPSSFAQQPMEIHVFEPSPSGFSLNYKGSLPVHVETRDIDDDDIGSGPPDLQDNTESCLGCHQAQQPRPPQHQLSPRCLSCKCVEHIEHLRPTMLACNNTTESEPCLLSDVCASIFLWRHATPSFAYEEREKSARALENIEVECCMYIHG